MEDRLNNKLVCRVCLKVVDSATQTFGYIDDDIGTLKEMMFCCVPEMDVYVSSDPVMCFPCIQTLVGLHNFKTRCINTETIIRSYMQRHNLPEFSHVDLISVVRDLIRINDYHKSIEERRRYIEMKQRQLDSEQLEKDKLSRDNQFSPKSTSSEMLLQILKEPAQSPVVQEPEMNVSPPADVRTPRVVREPEMNVSPPADASTSRVPSQTEVTSGPDFTSPGHTQPQFSHPIHNPQLAQMDRYTPNCSGNNSVSAPNINEVRSMTPNSLQRSQIQLTDASSQVGGGVFPFFSTSNYSPVSGNNEIRPQTGRSAYSENTSVLSPNSNEIGPLTHHTLFRPQIDHVSSQIENTFPPHFSTNVPAPISNNNELIKSPSPQPTPRPKLGPLPFQSRMSYFSSHSNTAALPMFRYPQWSPHQVTSALPNLGPSLPESIPFQQFSRSPASPVPHHLDSARSREMYPSSAEMFARANNIMPVPERFPRFNEKKDYVIDRGPFQINHHNSGGQRIIYQMFPRHPPLSPVRFMPRDSVPFHGVRQHHTNFVSPNYPVFRMEHRPPHVGVHSHTSNRDPTCSIPSQGNPFLAPLPPIESPVVPLSVHISAVQIPESPVITSPQEPVKAEKTEDENEPDSEQTALTDELSKDESTTDEQIIESKMRLIIRIPRSYIDIPPKKTENSNENGLEAEERNNLSFEEERKEEESEGEQNQVQDVEMTGTVTKTQNENQFLVVEPTDNTDQFVYQCYNCPFNTISSELFLKHRDLCKPVDESNNSFRCPHCPHTTSRQFALNKHISSLHTRTVWFLCDHCSYKTADKVSLKKHTDNVHCEKKIYSCIHCDFTSTSEYYFNKHSGKHETVLLQCNLCSYSTTNKGHFRRHIFIHNPKKTMCDFCDYETVSPYQMTHHLKKYHDGVGTEDVDLRKDTPLMELLNDISAAVKDSNEIKL